MSVVGPRRPKGVARRAMILEAAITVISEQGLEALSHRRVAAAAGVPLTATTYYFESLDELRSAALNAIVARDFAAMEEHFQHLPPTGELGATLAQLIWDWLQDRESYRVTMEIFASAMRRDSVREIAQAWDRAWIDVLTPRVGRTRALVAVCTAFGYMQHSLLEDDPPSLEEVTTVMRLSLGEMQDPIADAARPQNAR